jgi:acetylornithine/succinyldiaminopimelate/putrescine aminotransferase
MVVDAVKKQSEQYMHLMVYGELISAPQVQYATKITSFLPETLQSVYFTNSGTEATEGAMKLAKRLTGRTKIVGFKDSYHGSTQGALSVMGDEYWRNAFRPLLPGVVHLEHNNIRELDNIDTDTACVIAEPIQAERGVKTPSAEWMKALRARCDETGALLILDEIQTGMGRTGTLFAFEQFDIVPDILLLGKALGGGMPLGAFISSTDRMNAFASNPVLGHITTFGGHPVCCAAGLAAFQFLLDEELINGVEQKAELFAQRLKHPLIRDFRSAGLLMAIDFGSWDLNKLVIDTCIARGVFTDWFLFAAASMRLAPPLIITEDEINRACDIILAVCDEVRS